MELANAVSSDPGALQRVEASLSADKVLGRPALLPTPENLSADKVDGISSDERFARALAAASVLKSNASTPLYLRAPSGKSIGSVAFGPSGARLLIDKKYTSAFEGFLQEEVPGLMQKFFARHSEE